MSVSLLMAPLQGFTEAAVRNAFDRCFGGISEYYTPFIRLEKGTFRNKDLKDADPANNGVACLIPQIIAADAREAYLLTERLAGWGYRCIDINMSCPFPPMVHKGRGAGILAHPEKVAQVLSVADRFPEIRFSVKLRLGWASSDEVFALLDILNAVPLRQVTLHPRLGVQQYKGFCSDESFSRFYELCSNPLVYNGDIRSVSGLTALIEKYPRLKGVMIGRGLLAEPWLAAEYQDGKSWTGEQKRRAFREFHQNLLSAYSEKIEGGEQQLLGKMKSFWEYLLVNEERKKWKKVRKAVSLPDYCRAVDELASSL